MQTQQIDELSERLCHYWTQLETDAERATAGLYGEWLEAARTKQLPPLTNHNIWLILAGRGWGKTRTGAQDIALYALRNSNVQCAVVAPTHGDLRRVCFNGPSGLLNIIPKECFDPKVKGYSSSTSEIRLWNGSKITGYAAIDPDRLRGPQFHRAWADELAAWRYPEAFDQLMFSLRLGEDPKCLITTTPKPSALIKSLTERDDCIVTQGNTFENAENLAESALAMLKSRYEGTTLGRQELYAEIINAADGALWSLDLIEDGRVSKVPEMKQILVAIDPAVTSGPDSDETGIMCVGKDENNEYYVLEDRSGRYSPDEWARKAVDLYERYDADRIVAEVNNGGDLVERLLRAVDAQVPYRSVHATRGKLVRAEPVASLYEQGKVHHLGRFPELESQMVSYTGQRSKPSPDRLDALVWGLSELAKSKGEISWRVS